MAKRPPLAVLDKLAAIAGIHKSPYPVPTVGRDGSVIGYVSNLENFNSQVIGAIRSAHLIAGMMNAKPVESRQQIARHARALETLLRAMTGPEKEKLACFLPTACRDAADDLINAVCDVALAARRMASLSVRRPGESKRIARQALIEHLLDAAAGAGGNLTLNQRTGRGSLVEAIELLSHYLPADYWGRSGLSYASLKRIRERWAQNRKKKPPSRLH